MTDFATIAPYLWWTMLLASTAIILHDLASKAFAGKPSDLSTKKVPLPVPDTPLMLAARDSITRNIELSSTGFQREAADAILGIALAAHGSALTRIPERNRDMLDELFNDAELKEFVEMSSAQSIRRIDRMRMRQELERTYTMLERAERLYK